MVPNGALNDSHGLTTIPPRAESNSFTIPIVYIISIKLVFLVEFIWVFYMQLNDLFAKQYLWVINLDSLIENRTVDG